jgi:exonuclease VII small subunit
VQELELANAALVRRAHQIPAPSSAELHAKLQFAENRVQQLMADYEDKQV